MADVLQTFAEAHSWTKVIFIFIELFMKFVPEALIDIKSTPVLVMAWRRTGNKSLPKLTMTQFIEAYTRHLTTYRWFSARLQ